MASVAPKIQIYDSEDRIKDSWNVGKIDVHDADSYQSDPLVIYVWNNRYDRDNAVPDLKGAYITTKNLQGDNINEQAVTDLWVQACVDSKAEPDNQGGKKFTKIGGDTVAPVEAQGNLGADEKLTIKGTANDGTARTYLSNYSKITLKIVPDINAIPGIHYFKIRVAGYYM